MKWILTLLLMASAQFKPLMGQSPITGTPSDANYILLYHHKTDDWSLYAQNASDNWVDKTNYLTFDINLLPVVHLRGGKKLATGVTQTNPLVYSLKRGDFKEVDSQALANLAVFAQTLGTSLGGILEDQSQSFVINDIQSILPSDNNSPSRSLSQEDEDTILKSLNDNKKNAKKNSKKAKRFESIIQKFSAFLNTRWHLSNVNFDREKDIDNYQKKVMSFRGKAKALSQSKKEIIKYIRNLEEFTISFPNGIPNGLYPQPGNKTPENFQTYVRETLQQELEGIGSEELVPAHFQKTIEAVKEILSLPIYIKDPQSKEMIFNYLINLKMDTARTRFYAESKIPDLDVNHPARKSSFISCAMADPASWRSISDKDFAEEGVIVARILCSLVELARLFEKEFDCLTPEEILDSDRAWSDSKAEFNYILDGYLAYANGVTQASRSLKGLREAWEKSEVDREAMVRFFFRHQNLMKSLGWIDTPYLVQTDGRSQSIVVKEPILWLAGVNKAKFNKNIQGSFTLKKHVEFKEITATMLVDEKRSFEIRHRLADIWDVGYSLFYNYQIQPTYAAIDNPLFGDSDAPSDFTSKPLVLGRTEEKNLTGHAIALNFRLSDLYGHPGQRKNLAWGFEFGAGLEDETALFLGGTVTLWKYIRFGYGMIYQKMELLRDQTEIAYLPDGSLDLSVQPTFFEMADGIQLQDKFELDTYCSFTISISDLPFFKK